MDLRERDPRNPYRHPWELSRAECILHMLAGRSKSTRYADIGSGDLYFARRLGRLSDQPVYAVDANYHDEVSEAGIIKCTAVSDLPSSAVDCAVLMDVLEHVDDERGFLEAVSEALTADASLLVTVPAHRALWSQHDVGLEHRRRYSRPGLLALLAAHGFRARECFYFYLTALAARTLDVCLVRLRAQKPEFKGVGAWGYSEDHALTSLGRKFLNVDFRITRRLSRVVPGLGLSICAICEKRSAS